MAYLPKELAVNGMIFSLIDEKVTEDFSLWDNTAKQFIRNGTVIANDDTVYNVEDLRGMPKSDFNRLFIAPKDREGYHTYAKSFKYKRDVIVKGNQYTWGMPYSVNEKLKELMAMARSMGSNPLTISYKLGFSGSGLGKKYHLEAVVPEGVTQPVVVVPPPSPPPLPGQSEKRSTKGPGVLSVKQSTLPHS